ncbi:MAG: hypothetical protein ACPHP2_11930 [Limisphaerales bacterium]
MTILRNFTALFFFIAAINLANAKPNVLLIVCDDLNDYVETLRLSAYQNAAPRPLSQGRYHLQPSLLPVPGLRAVAGVVSQRPVPGVVRRAE